MQRRDQKWHISSRCCLDGLATGALLYGSHNPEASAVRFLDGLVDYIKDEIYARDPPEHLDDLIDIAVCLDSRMELRRRVRDQFSRHRAELFDSPSASQVPEALNGVEPMQVGRMRLFAKEKQRHLSEGLCLYCGGHGHLVASCPLKGNARQ